jgi:hypothetical protein
MSQLKIAVREDHTQFLPGDEIIAAAYWNLDGPPKSVEARLFWFTRGKGTQDVNVVETFRFDHPLVEEARPVRFRLPEAPYSFSGKLVSLIWALELVVEPGSESARIELTVSPTGEEINLDRPSVSPNPP